MLILETERLSLREADVNDAAFIVQLVNEPDWLRFIGDRGIRTLEAGREYILSSFVEMYGRCGFGLWLVERREDGVALGICGLLRRGSSEDVEIGFAFLSNHRGNGYAFEAGTATMSYAKDVLGLGQIVAVVSSDNEDSKRLLEKLGFRFERITRLTASAPLVELYVQPLVS